MSRNARALKPQLRESGHGHGHGHGWGWGGVGNAMTRIEQEGFWTADVVCQLGVSHSAQISGQM